MDAVGRRARLPNLLNPDGPEKLDVRTPSGTWTLIKADFFPESHAALANGQCAITYSIEHPISLSVGAGPADQAFDMFLSGLRSLSGTAYVSLFIVTDFPEDAGVAFNSMRNFERGSPRMRS